LFGKPASITVIVQTAVALVKPVALATILNRWSDTVAVGVPVIAPVPVASKVNPAGKVLPEAN